MTSRRSSSSQTKTISSRTILPPCTHAALPHCCHVLCVLTRWATDRYKIGDTFFHIALEQAQEMLGASTERIEGDIGGLEEKLGAIREEMTQLKVQLYARFGRSINLET